MVRIRLQRLKRKRPVQICLICYVNQQGELDMVAHLLLGILRLPKHVQNVLEMPKGNGSSDGFAGQLRLKGITVESLTAPVHDKYARRFRKGCKPKH